MALDHHVDWVYMPSEGHSVQILILDFPDKEIILYVHDLACIIVSHMRLPFDTFLCEGNRCDIRTVVS